VAPSVFEGSTMSATTIGITTLSTFAERADEGSATRSS